MRLHLAIALALTGVLAGSGCLLSPQPEPPDLVDPPGDGGEDGDGLAPHADCDPEDDDCTAGSAEDPCGCDFSGALPGDCGGEETGRSSDAGSVMVRDRNDFAIFAADDDDDPVMAGD